MPIYEYECGDCGKVQEILQKMSDNPVAECPDCSGRLQKRVSQCTFHLKGSGWYATDYANSSGKSSSSPESKNNRQPKADPSESSGSDGASCVSGGNSADPKSA